MTQFLKAKGTKGILINDGKYTYFRIYKGTDFIDYRLDHNDLEVEIIDDDAEFDTVNETLDHSRQTLGRE